MNFDLGNVVRNCSAVRYWDILDDRRLILG